MLPSVEVLGSSAGFGILRGKEAAVAEASLPLSAAETSMLLSTSKFLGLHRYLQPQALITTFCFGLAWAVSCRVPETAQVPRSEFLSLGQPPEFLSLGQPSKFLCLS